MICGYVICGAYLPLVLLSTNLYYLMVNKGSICVFVEFCVLLHKKTHNQVTQIEKCRNISRNSSEIQNVEAETCGREQNEADNCCPYLKD